MGYNRNYRPTPSRDQPKSIPFTPRASKLNTRDPGHKPLQHTVTRFFDRKRGGGTSVRAVVEASKGSHTRPSASGLGSAAFEPVAPTIELGCLFAIVLDRNTKGVLLSLESEDGHYEKRWFNPESFNTPLNIGDEFHLNISQVGNAFRFDLQPISAITPEEFEITRQELRRSIEEF